MNRYIFRAWDKKLAVYANGPSNTNIDWNTTLPFKYYESHKSVILQQCIGKQDRFGKWIFEGDILLMIHEPDDEYNYSGESKVQLFIDEDLVWMLKDIKEGPRSWGQECFADYYEKDRFVVIGNIYEGYMTDKEIHELFKTEDLKEQKLYEEMEMDV